MNHADPSSNERDGFRIVGCSRDTWLFYDEGDGRTLEIPVDFRWLRWECWSDSFERWHGSQETLPPQKQAEIIRALTRFGRKYGHRFRVRRRRTGEDRFTDIRACYRSVQRSGSG